MVMFSEELLKTIPAMRILSGHMHIHRRGFGYIMKGSIGSIRSDLNPLHVFRIVVGSMRLLVTQWNLTKGAFDLLGEGKLMTETIIRLIEVEK